MLTGGKILSLEFLFQPSKASDTNIGIIAKIVCLWKTRLMNLFVASDPIKFCTKLFRGAKSTGNMYPKEVIQSIYLLSLHYSTKIHRKLDLIEKRND